MRKPIKTHHTKLTLLILLILITIGCNLAPGSYPYAEKYDLNKSDYEVKEAISAFKKRHPEYNVPKTTINNKGSYDLFDEPTEDPNYGYAFYFYYKDRNQIVLTIVRKISENESRLLLVSINDGLDLGKWKDINKDFDESENEKQKELFEEHILNKIKEDLKL